MNSFFRDVIANLIKTAFEGHTEFSVADNTAVGDNPVRTLKLDAVSIDGNSLISLAWDGGEKLFEKKLSDHEAQHEFDLISNDLAEAVSLTQKGEYDAAKAVMAKLVQKYSENTGTIIDTNAPKLNTTQASEESNIWKQAKVSLRNIFPSGTVQQLDFDSPDELSAYQEKMKSLSPQDRIPLWDKENPSQGEEKHEIAPPSISYDQMEKDKAKETKNLDKRIKEEVKDQIQSSLDEKKATLFTDKDKELVDAMRNHGRTWDEIKKYMVKELSYDKESVDLYIDDLRQKEEGVSEVPEAPGAVPPELKPPTDLVSPETHEKLLKDHEDKKEPKFTPKEIMEIPEDPIEDESALNEKCPGCGHMKPMKGECPSCKRCDCEQGHATVAPNMNEIARADNGEIHKIALNPLQEPPVETAPTLPNQDTVPMEAPMSHPALQNGDRVFVSSDLSEEKAGFEGIFISEYQSKGTKFSVVETDNGELVDVESHRVVKTSERPTQETEPTMEPKIEMPKGDEVSVTPKLSDLTSGKKCPDCGKDIWDKSTVDQRLNKCWNCGLRFDNPEVEASKPDMLQREELYAIKAEIEKLDKIVKEAESHVIMPMMYGIDDDSILQYANGSIYREKIEKNQMADKDWESLLKDTARWMTQVQREKVSQTFSTEAEWKFDPEQINKLKSMFSVLPKASSQGVTADAPELPAEHICEQCKQPMGYQGFLGPICDKCVKKNHKKVTGSEDDEVGMIMAFEDGSLPPEDVLKLFSLLVRNGHAWSLQGSYGRAAKSLIEQGYLDDKGNILKDLNAEAAASVKMEKKAAPQPTPADDAAPKTKFKDVKITPDYVDKEKVVPATPEMEQVIIKMNSLQSKLATLDKTKEDIKVKMMEELKKIDVAGERSQAEKELQEAYEKMNVLINATESKVIQWSDQLYTLQSKEEEIVPKPTQKELLEKIYAKFDGAEKYVESVLNGFKSLAKKLTTQTVVRWPKRSEQETMTVTKEASVMDDLEQMTNELLEALKLLSGSVA